MMRKTLFYALFLTLALTQVKAQMVNKGVLLIKDGTVVSAENDLENGTGGDFINQGKIFIKGAIVNDGYFHFKEKGKPLLASNASLSLNGDGATISGTKEIFTNDVVLEAKRKSAVFRVEVPNFHIHGEASFDKGFINNGKNPIVFEQHATVKSISDDSFIRGLVTKKGTQKFDFPVGGDFYRPVSLGTATADRSVSVRYYNTDSDFDYPHKDKKGVDVLDDQEYWTISSDDPQKESITLFWNDNTTSTDILSAKKEDLIHAFWDLKNRRWVGAEKITLDEPNQSLKADYSLETTMQPFALAVKSYDLIFYNVLSRDGDNLNRILYIEGIENYPDNNLRIFDTNGIKQFEIAGYDNENKVFEGESNVGGKHILPANVYYYVLVYKDEDGKEYIKKGILYIQ